MMKPYHQDRLREVHDILLTVLGQEVIDADFKDTPRIREIVDAIKPLSFLIEVYCQKP